MNQEIIEYDIPGIMSCQLNRYPMLFIDKVTDCFPGVYAKGYKLFSYNEWFFHGYETKDPKVWNVIQIESMSQMFLMTFLTLKDYQGSIAMSNKFDNVNFYKKISPGDKLNLEAELKTFRRGIAKGFVRGFLNDDIACSMECTIIIPTFFDEIKGKFPVEKLKYNLSNEIQPLLNFGIKEIKKCLLNNYPWLLIDKILNIQVGKYVHAIKNFTYNESFFPSHFPDNPSVPGFIQIESCMQGFLMTFLSIEDNNRKETADRKLDDVRVKRKIVPGETLDIFAFLDSFKRGVAIGRVESYVNGEPATSFKVTVIVPEIFNSFLPS